MSNQPVLYGERALGALDALAARNPEVSDAISTLGRRILELPSMGLRQHPPLSIYDIAFVGPNNGNPRKSAFVTFVTATNEGKWNRNSVPDLGNILIGVKVEQMRSLVDPKQWLTIKTFRSQGGGHWYEGYVFEKDHRQDYVYSLVQRVHDLEP